MERVAADLLEQGVGQHRGAIIASPTTPAAGTTQVSLRSTEASCGSFVARSTERSGMSSVGMGFTTACARISSPFVTPPSSPPARFVGR